MTALDRLVLLFLTFSFLFRDEARRLLALAVRGLRWILPRLLVPIHRVRYRILLRRAGESCDLSAFCQLRRARSRCRFSEREEQLPPPHPTVNQ